MFLSFVMQIVLSEVLGVPATIESGSFDPSKRLSFYDAESNFPYPVKAYYFDELRTSNNASQADCTAAIADGVPCANIMPEVWAGQRKTWTDAAKEGYIEPPLGTGMVGKLSWTIPTFLARNDPTLTTYHGLQGPANRRKLADKFKRPTTWSVYCSEVSETSCATEDGIAMRAPNREEIKDGLGDKFRVAGLFRGYFRKTDKNDCTANPDTCSGHFVDAPCDWSTSMEQQAYWNDIALESDGPLEPNGGYSYGDMIDIWTAANETKSAVMMWWWTPDATVETWEGTDGEFQRVALPVPSDPCRFARVSSADRCSKDIQVRRGLEEGRCEDEHHTLKKIIASSLNEHTFSVDAPSRSPAYETIKNMRISDLSMDSMLKSWVKRGVDTWGFDPREAVCAWVADNLDQITASVPRGHPHTLVHDTWYGNSSGLLYSALVLAVLVTACVCATAGISFKYRAEKVIKNAQAKFLAMILAGFLLVSIAAVVYVLEPSLGSCVAKQWLVTMGYTLGLVPLLVKVAAINKITQGAKKMKKITLKPKQLIGAVALVVAIVMIYLVVWAVVDPPTRHTFLVLTEEGGHEVKERLECSSSSDTWVFVAMAWECFVLVCASVLGFQARNVRQEFNESKVLGALIYDHLLFMALRVMTYVWFWSGGMAANVHSGVTSLLLSLDTVTSILIYFGQKFLRIWKPDWFETRRPTIYRSLSERLVSARVLVSARNLFRLSKQKPKPHFTAEQARNNDASDKEGTSSGLEMPSSQSSSNVEPPRVYRPHGIDATLERVFRAREDDCRNEDINPEANEFIQDETGDVSALEEERHRLQSVLATKDEEWNTERERLLKEKDDMLEKIISLQDEIQGQASLARADMTKTYIHARAEALKEKEELRQQAEVAAKVA